MLTVDPNGWIITYALCDSSSNVAFQLPAERTWGLNSGSRSDMESSFHSLPVISILCVEDDNIFLDLLGVSIAKKYPHFRIQTARNGKTGLQCFRKFAPDIVITDINMPDMDGIEMAREISSISDVVKFIFLSGHYERNNLERLSEFGCAKYMAKPVNLKELFTVIDLFAAEVGMSVFQKGTGMEGAR
jgi:CheY-like chemotaxis protein